MWIEKTKTGFRAVERYTCPLTGKQKKISVSMEKNTAATRKAAEKMLMEKIENKYESRQDSITFEELTKLWLEDKMITVKPSSYYSYSNYVPGLIKVVGADTLVDALNARYINLRIKRMYSSPIQQKGCIKRIKIVLRWAYENDYIDDIAWLGKVKSPKVESTKKTRYLESQELVVLLKHMYPANERDLTKFLALSGCRIGEALALTYEDIDLDERLIHITKTYNPELDQVQTAKSIDSVRDVFIQNELYPLCVRLKKRRFINPLVFYGIQYATYRVHLADCSAKALGKKITPHALRHTHVALLAEKGIPLETISRRLGHKDTKVTRDIYFHVTQNLKEKDHEAIREISIL